LKETSSDDPDFQFLEEADKRIKQIVDEANERTRQLEKSMKVQQLRRLFKGTLVRFFFFFLTIL
jgi:hypothetical protein